MSERKYRVHYRSGQRTELLTYAEALGLFHVFDKDAIRLVRETVVKTREYEPTLRERLWAAVDPLFLGFLGLAGFSVAVLLVVALS